MNIWPVRVIHWIKIEAMSFILTIEYREHMQEELDKFIKCCESCNEKEMEVLAEQLLYALERYSEKH